jgi:dihydroxyacetone kinase-like predicted kinase
VKSGEVTYAVRKTRFNGVEVEEKDTIGLLDDQLKAAGKSLPDVTESLVGEMVRDGAEIATLYHGADVPREEAEVLVERLQKTFPKVEMELHYGGQPLYYYLISVE